MSFYLILAARLVLASVLGGIIGYEREHTHRPAGFRTHILVCVGAALVMVTSEFIFRRYSGSGANIDPARLGAQVISGIGFLGAGTIIREGFNVRGLTTAASLWAVSCVGIAAGIGFYEGAILAAFLVYITLIMLKRMEHHFAKKNQCKYIYIQSNKKHGQIGSITDIFDKYGTVIKNIEFCSVDKDESQLLIKLMVKMPSISVNSSIINDLNGVEGIVKVYEE